MTSDTPSRGRPPSGKPWDDAATRVRRTRQAARQRGLVRVEVLLPEAVADRLQEQADQAGLSRSAWIAALLAR
jgi:hypothetical protein